MSLETYPPIVLVTGANGSVGSSTVLELMKQGYRVKAIVRSQSKAEAFEYPAQSSSIEWIVVHDLTDEAAMTTTASGVDHIIHIACPYYMYFNNADPVKDILAPVKEITLTLFKAAAKHAQIKRIVMTSSFMGVWDLDKADGLQPGKMRTGTVRHWNRQLSKNPIFVLSSAKSIAEKVAYDFVEAHKPTFSLTTFCPPIVWGPPAQARLTTSSLNTSFLSSGSVLAVNLRSWVLPNCRCSSTCAIAHTSKWPRSPAKRQTTSATSLSRARVSWMSSFMSSDRISETSASLSSTGRHEPSNSFFSGHVQDGA